MQDTSSAVKPGAGILKSQVHDNYTQLRSKRAVNLPSETQQAAVAAPAGQVPASEVIVPLWAKLVAGGIAGVIGTSLIFPLDMVKTRLQNQGSGAAKRYNGPIDCFKKILATEGSSGLYRGLKPNLIGVTPEKAIKLSANDFLREYFVSKNGDRQIKLHQEIMAGGFAGLFQVAATNPMEIVKLRMQLQGESGQHKSALATASELGPRGLYKGVGACWLRDVPFSFIFFPLFAHLKRSFNGGENNLFGLFMAGALAGSLAAGSVTPFDVVKTRLQVVGADTRYSGIMDCITKTYRDEGAVAFAKGIQPRMLVQAPLFGITLLSYEFLKDLYRK